MSHPEGTMLDLVVVGAGPVGLLAGILAADAGLRVQVLEAAPAPRRHSRAIGIHPPVLRLLDTLPAEPGGSRSLAMALVEAGTRVRRGQAFRGPLGRSGSHLGTLPFDLLDPPFAFVLTVPQWRTEAILEAALVARSTAPATGTHGRDGAAPILRRGVRVLGVEALVRPAEGAAGVAAQAAEGTRVRTQVRAQGRAQGSAGALELEAAFVLACDGRDSSLRRQAGIAFQGAPYPHRYLMGDFQEEGGEPLAPDEAAIFVAREGLVESFPLEAGVRRWVVERSPGTGTEASLGELVAAVEARVGVALDPARHRMVSAFGVERYLASDPWPGRLILAGDAAHVVSPIGGQGMNLGWMHVHQAVRGVQAVMQGEATLDEAAHRYRRAVRQRARAVARRAEGNMRLGQRLPGGSAVLHALRGGALRILLHSPLRRLVARRFTMHGLGWGMPPSRPTRGSGVREPGLVPPRGS